MKMKFMQRGADAEKRKQQLAEEEEQQKAAAWSKDASSTVYVSSCNTQFLAHLFARFADPSSSFACTHHRTVVMDEKSTTTGTSGRRTFGAMPK